ncbi:hypothetical protein D1007_37388 [Hordeum vulgare]|nr:hypothetical protein D1007_37388 [Hordeum vulgare]
MSGFLRRPLVVCDLVCAAARSGLTRLGTPGSSPSLSFAPADANFVSVSLSMLSAAAMRSNVGAGVVWEFSPASRANCWPAHVEDKACAEVKNKETETQGPLSDEQRHNIFQTTYKGTLQCKSSQPRGYGYIAKPSTGSERIRIQMKSKLVLQ